jgi:hypothetical protein
VLKKEEIKEMLSKWFRKWLKNKNYQWKQWKI